MSEIITKRASSPLETSLLGISVAAFLGAAILAGMKANTMYHGNAETVQESAKAWARSYNSDLNELRSDLELTGDE